MVPYLLSPKEMVKQYWKSKDEEDEEAYWHYKYFYHHRSRLQKD
jgi:hypothetical protein